LQKQRSRPFWNRCRGIALAGILASSSPLLLPEPGIAQLLLPEVRNAFLSNPLNDEPLDPLLPETPIRRPLSPLEQYQLEQDLDELALVAEAIAAGDALPEDAPIDLGPGEELPDPNAIWMREVRLRRLLEVEKELQAIQRVAQWMRDRNSTQELQLLAARLREIQQGLDPSISTDRTRLIELAEIYAILGEVEDAAVIRRALANQALVVGDEEEFQNQLEILADLQAAWFYFDDAAATYGELLALAQLEPSRNNETQYLQAQIYNLEQAQEFAAALAAQQQLLAIYNGAAIFWPRVPALQHDIAENYRIQGNLSEASRYFRSAYANALAQTQLNLAAEAIRSLSSIYLSLERWEDVRYLYEQLILVERRANNAFGLMETYDSLGQLYEQLEQPTDALAAYREGLVMARALDHRVGYFEAQVDRLVGG
jgi:tetratricopeptide (TPR) repeat protein